jgi:hypothetical protein
MSPEAYVNGIRCLCPPCGKCGLDDMVHAKDMDDGTWCFYCERCDRPIPYEEFEEGNP